MRVIKSAAMFTALLLGLLGTAVIAQVRQVDQGRKGVQAWPMVICDTSGTNCIGTETTGTVGVYRLLTSTAAGGAGGGTVDQGAGGTSAWFIAFDTTGVNNNVDVVTATITQIPAITGTVQANAGTGTLAVSGTVTATPTGTQAVSGTVQANAGTGTQAVSVVTGTIGQITMPSLTVTSGTIGSITMPALTFTSGTVGSMPALTMTSGTIGNTVAINVTQIGGVALSTAAPMIQGGRGSTDVPTAVANGAQVAQRLNKWGDTITSLAPYDLLGFGTTAVTATTAAQILASSGANTKWAITAVTTCNLSGVVATIMHFTDSSGTLFSFPWTQTATSAGEARCYMQEFPSPYLAATNSTISVQLTTSNATGVRANITAYKTGT